ncbi:TetR family transcriptional regulator [Streptosporangium lutulentum]|uniref:AcrR family transcriptional regulator n=1 Tax=Streptosporangium lutulentum TaxID=1461250 RepID=A0ABT9Q9M8_9ACTN|nr:TetR family transcriptional regulator [Streptosporangium lutulentum]MDP9843033.1 AcrR family transcriptional regulator [Streptosporangium lutulentum]
MTIVDNADELGRRHRKKLETRAALEHAALTLVAERGLAGVTVEDIAEAVDVSSRTFFNYFPSKEDALIGPSPASATELRERLEALPSDVPVLEALRLMSRIEAGHVQEQREQWLLRLKVFKQNPSLLPRLVVGGTETERVLTSAVARRVGVEPGTSGYPELATAAAMAAFRVAMIRWSAADGSPSLADLVDEAFSQLAAGLPNP